MSVDSTIHTPHNPTGSLTRRSPLLRLGLVLFGAAGLADLFYHSLEAAGLHGWMAQLETLVGHEAYPVHVLLVIGMMLIWLGIMLPGEARR